MDWIYIAGFFDGEGSITHNSGIGFRVSIPQTNEQVLNEIRDFTRLGSVIKITKRQPHWKDCWVYAIANKKDVLHFLNKITPYLIVKKGLSLKVIAELKQQLIDIEIKKKIHDKRKHEAKLLRLKGWDYRKIGKELKIDWGYARRLILDLV